ncbi:MAG TPA: YfiR family protein [Bryobacteraceae bacterium]|nr:YfiR family protein [Bryobacteraceae bacterium]
MAQVTFHLRRIGVVVLVALLAAMTDAGASAPGSLEYAVKATYLLKFTRFVAWPQAAMGTNETFNICILGSDPFGATLNQVVAGEEVAGRKIAIQRLEREPAPGACQVLYIGEHQDRPRFTGEPGRAVLTVGEGSDFARNGGMIGFVIDNRRVTFDINWRAAEASGLKLSSGLLTVAQKVIR